MMLDSSIRMVRNAYRQVMTSSGIMFRCTSARTERRSPAPMIPMSRSSQSHRVAFDFKFSGYKKITITSIKNAGEFNSSAIQYFQNPIANNPICLYRYLRHQKNYEYPYHYVIVRVFLASSAILDDFHAKLSPRYYSGQYDILVYLVHST